MDIFSFIYNKQRIFLFQSLLILGLILCLSINTVSAYSAKHVEINSVYVHAEGWNSCTGGWYWTSGTFSNYCPWCGKKLSKENIEFKKSCLGSEPKIV